jgi:purine-nucleoside phosphorylase
MASHLGRHAIDAAAAYVKSRAIQRPSIGIVLGSGLMHVAELLESRVTLPYASIPHSPLSRVHGHEGALHFGYLGDRMVACLSGRAHGYEGHSAERVVFGVRLLAQLGCALVVLTNAAGSVLPTLLPGSLMLITDHLNLTGGNPLIGWYEQSPCFVDMTNAYDLELRQLAISCATDASIPLAQGIYAGLAGPSYETPAEVRMLAILGASAVGMSTVHETIALRDMGVRVLGVSCITNMGAGLEGAILDHKHVQRIAQDARHQLEELIRLIAKRVRLA